MTHPYWYFHNVEQNINEAFDLLHDVNDNKATVIKILSELKDLIKKQRNDFDEFGRTNKYAQLSYFDNVTIDFSVRNLEDKVIQIFKREYKDSMINMKMIKDIIQSEQAIQNENENLVNAKVTMIICEDSDYEEGSE